VGADLHGDSRDHGRGRLSKEFAMFVQVIQGQATDAGELRAAFNRWVEELAPGASGWLGTTAGVTDEGAFFALVRFESEQAARRNSDRPEQGQWWAETSKLFTGDVTFLDSHEAYLGRGGGSDDAGFVQVIQRRVRDVARAREILQLLIPVVAEFRPEDLGTVVAEHGDDGFTVVVYFTSEQAARQTERKPAPELKALRDEQHALSVGPSRYFDLRQPWLYSPR
jgi:hypothetical protein